MRLRFILMTCVASSGLLPLAAAAEANQGRLQRSTKSVVSEKNVAKHDLAAAKASVQHFIKRVDIPYDSFTLPNGLRVLVHTDRIAPRVNVSVWYDVGSKHEPAGRSGFAHLFEHLMFNGSENVPGDYMKPLMAVGADVNGSTSPDRTNYYETVPTPALDRALFMESDRMGHLLGGIDQATLDEQRGVVLNEKRQGDDGPTSIVQYKSRDVLYPVGHPYGHSVIGSMKDLNSADLDDVRQWFKSHYGPNNAVLILAGDIDLPTARSLVTKYFATIPSGPRNVRPNAGPVPMTRTVEETTTAPITSALVIRRWPVPGVNSPDGLALDGVMGVMGDGDDNILTRKLVREQQLFSNLNANNASYAQAGEFTVSGTVRPGVDPKVAAVALDKEIDRFLSNIPSEDAVTRFVARFTYQYVRQLEDVPARGAVLGEGAMSRANPDAYKDDLRFYTSLTPVTMMIAARRWLSKPHYKLTVLPGPRVTPKNDVGIDGGSTTTSGTEEEAKTALRTSVTPITGVSNVTVPKAAADGYLSTKRMALPKVGPSPNPTFPPIEHARLANGIPVVFARFPSIPFTTVGLQINGGAISEPIEQAGTAGLMYSMLNEGFSGRNEHWFAQRKERLGISLSAGIGSESGGVFLDSPDTNLNAGLEMLRGMLSEPNFEEPTLERLKRERLDRLSARRLDANTLLKDAILPRIDRASPFNRVQMYDDPNRVRSITLPAIAAAYKRWIRPEYAQLTVVSDQPLSAVLPKLEQAIGSWRPAGTPLPLPKINQTPQPAASQVLLIDLPGAVQATLQGGQTIPMTDDDPREALELANAVLAGQFTSRVNMNLREDKHWSYGFSGSAVLRPYGSYYSFGGKVQQDKVGLAIKEVMKEVSDITGKSAITTLELAQVKTAALAQAATAYSNRYAVAGALDDLLEHNRSDDYPGQISQRLRAVTLEDANSVLDRQFRDKRWIWGIVGNAATIRPQLDQLGLPVTVLKPEEILPPM